jgi:aminopeptidase-like protein
MMQCIEDLWFQRRDLVSDGFDASLDYLGKLIPLEIHAVPSGTQCWTWTVPEKWSVGEAYIEEAGSGRRVLDVADHPLHVVSYSLPVDKELPREELLRHIITNPARPHAIPFGYKYYERDWGFCLQHDRLGEFTKDRYRAVIRSSFEKGTLKVGCCTIPGETEETVALIAHLCHPAMVNDDLCGVAVGAKLAQELAQRKNRYTYKIFFLPETIGSIAYLSTHEEIIPRVSYGIFLEMLGNDNIHALQLTRQGNTRWDRIARYVLRRKGTEFREGPFRMVVGNDEMVWNGPGVDIPTISISRFPYPEYHTSDDTPAIISAERLRESKELVMTMLHILDNDYVPTRTFKGPVFLSGYGLWVKLEENRELNRKMEQVMLRLEGRCSVFDIADELDLDFDYLLGYLDTYYRNGLITKRQLNTKKCGT